ncbi:hypothetical protein CE91St25_16550 [Campylobacter ureolyticus]|uniref:hypothetical protein n=1 Tax=Campylobacter ureolyticus TaxID=827 RepID=UPI001FC854A1|nr:hypothetical protein [Campylobacter ureolyticus]GKH61319.1 hypothetical protein CE91St25_16550 [Campylobacter ureolyticus]
MTEYSKQILSDPKLLREKLSIYLNDSKSVESYAKACEKFFKAGKGEKLKEKMTWSWTAFLSSFLGPQWFLLYRGAIKSFCYVVLFLVWIGYKETKPGNEADFILIYTLISFIIFPIWYGGRAKFVVCKTFVEKLNLENDEALKPNRSFLYLFIAANIVLLCVAGYEIFASEARNIDEFLLAAENSDAFIALGFIQTAIPFMLEGMLFGAIGAMLF